MFPFARRAAAAAVLVTLAACADRPTPAEPGSGGSASSPSASRAGREPTTAQARHQRLARWLALALHDAEFRGTVYRALQESPEREGKVYLQRFLGNRESPARRRLAELALEPESAVSDDLDGAAPIEIYLPVPAHRRAWRGDAAILVATVEADREQPVGFDTGGHRRLLDAHRAPAIPVLALVRAEQEFRPAGLAYSETCFFECDGQTSGGDAGGTDPGTSAGGGSTSPGLYMTYAKLNSTFESWLKGDPELEVHMLGQDGTSKSMRSYQCAGAGAGIPYEYDQNDTQWSGSVMLFSRAQLDSYQAEHPTQALRVFLVEDDDGTCAIKTDSARVTNMFQQLIALYGDLTGGKKVELISVTTFTRASSLLNLFKSIWSFLTSADDIVGTAIEDVVAQEYFPGANWIVKGEGTITNGAIRLEMK